MERAKLQANLREEKGKEAVKKIRQQGTIPAVVYKGSKSQSIKVDAKKFYEITHTKAGENVLIDLEIEDVKQKKARTVIMKEIQHHPIRGDVLHIDFHEISLTETLTVKVPIVAKGEAPGVKEGGILEHILWELEVECLPTDIPENIAVNVSGLKMGDSVLVKDLKIPQGVRVLVDPESTVIAVAAPAAEEEPIAAEGEEAMEPEVIMERKPKDEEGEEDSEAQEPKKE